MANTEHLALIKEDVSVWNNWYKKNKKVVPDLSNANLSNINLSGINLHKADLRSANLSNTDLSKAQLDNANLEGANLLKANLQDANLKGASLDFVIFSQAKINSKTIIADKNRCVYNIINNTAENKNFTGADLSNSNLFRADLNNADLSNAKLVNANLNSANLSNAYLYRADLTKANLQNADLKNAYLSQANLTNANLAKASCNGTYLKDAELKFANLKTTKLSHKTMIDSKWYSVWEIVNRGAVGKNLSGMDFSQANLQGVNFEKANLSNAKLTEAILSHSNLTDANLTNTDLTGADIRNVDLDKTNLQKTKSKSAVGSHDNHLPATKSFDQSNVMIKEKPIAETRTLNRSTATSKTTEQVLTKNNQKQSKNRSIISILSLGIIVTFGAASYLFLQQSPNFSGQSWQQKLEQLIPAK